MIKGARVSVQLCRPIVVGVALAVLVSGPLVGSASLGLSSSSPAATLDGKIRNSRGAVVLVESDSAGHPGDVLPDDWQLWMWASDSRRLVGHSEASNLVEADTNGVSDIFVKDVATGTIQRISTNASGVQANGMSRNPQFSPNGERVAFWSDATNLVAGAGRGIYLKTLATGAIELLASGNSSPIASGQAWSPDGKTLAISGAGNAITLKDLANGSEQRLSTRRGTMLGWSSDSRRILTDKSVITVSTGESTPIGRVSRRAQSAGFTDLWGSPFSADGRWIAVLRAEGLYIRPLGSSKWERIDGGAVGTATHSDDEFSWSPRGRRLIFNVGGRLYMMTVDGAKSTVVAKGGVYTIPTWSPDSRYLAYKSTPARGGGQPVRERPAARQPGAR